MKPSHSQSRLRLLGVLTSVLCGLLVAWTLANRPGAAARGTFDSPVRPTHTPKAGNTSTSTPTLGAFLSPLGTPPTSTVSVRARLPLVLKPPTPTFTPTSTPTPTPFPTPGPYGWKGISDTWEADAIGIDAAPANQFWGLAPQWWYDWGYRVRDTAAQAATSPASTLAILEAGLKDIGYVPMLYCMSDASPAFLTPQDAAGLARKYPGRVWLLFNEPDNRGECGGSIKDPNGNPLVPASPWIPDPQGWTPLGQFLGRQYVLYYDAIKATDPSARLFAFNALQLPLPTLANLYWPNGVALWNAFLQELDRQGRPLDGIAIHVYPKNPSTSHGGCSNTYLDYGCVQEALTNAYEFFQGTDGTPSQNLYATLTRGKPIWITEIGTLTSVNNQSWISTRDGFEIPMINWFKQTTVSSGSCAYINGVAWFSTHSKQPVPSPTPPAWDNTASNLLDHISFPTKRQLSPVGAAWRDASCTTCQCPGSSCP